MTTKEELIEAINNSQDLCDLGYKYAELDRYGYCLWVMDCAKHLFPLAERHLSKTQMWQLSEALKSAESFLNGKTDASAITEALAIPKQITNTFWESQGQIPYHLFETLEAITNVIELTLPDSKVYHEDIIYGAARAAFYGRLHSDDSSKTAELSECNDMDELAGAEESNKETEWQRQALKLRLLNNGT